MGRRWTLGDSAKRQAAARRRNAEKARRLGMRPFFAALRADGFELDYDSRAGGTRCVEWKKTVGPRRVTVQLWGDGAHRASHFLNERMSTEPTGFSDVEGMRQAIARELQRFDHPPIVPAMRPPLSPPLEDPRG